MSSAFSIDFFEHTSEFKTPVTFLLVEKNTKCGYSFSKLDHKENLVIKLSGLLKFSLFLLLLLWFQFRPTLHIMQSHH